MNTRIHNHHETRHGLVGRALLFVGGIVVLAGAIAVLAFDMTRGGQADPETNGDNGAATGANGETPTDREPVTFTIEGELQQALDMIGRGRFMQARAMIGLYQKDRGPCPECEFMLGLSYHKEKRYEQARPFFETALELEPRYASAWYFYGWCLYYLSELEASREAFERHLAMDPLEGDSHFGVGLIEMDEGNLDEAEARFRTSIDLQKNNPRRLREIAKSHARLGDIFTLRDQLQEAKAELTLATEMWPGHYEAYFKLARVLYRLGEDDAADEAMERYEIGKRLVEGTLPLAEPLEQEDEP